MRRWLPRVALLGVVAALSWGPAEVVRAAPPQGMPDPSRMSGIPRPDPQLAPGTVTVRCLDGSFANPAIGIPVSLTLTAPDGTTAQRSAETVEKGRATFSDLDQFFGHTAVARASVAGQALESQPFVLSPQSGVALMLVASGGGGTAGVPGDSHGSPHGGPGADPHGGQGAVPVPGKPFPLAGRPRGTLIVGALDLGRAPEAGGIGPIPEVEITLTATAPGLAQPVVLTKTTDEEGRAVFEGLDESLPEGAQIVVEGVLEPQGEGTEAARSESFALGPTAYAVILARGIDAAAAAAAQRPPPPPTTRQRRPVPGPREDKSLSRGQVRVQVIDAFDRPVPDQKIVIHSSGMTGETGNVVGVTDARGTALIEEVPVDADILSQVQVIYSGAPYSSHLFEMPKTSGAMVVVRVFEPTADRTRVRSALQIDVTPRENDIASLAFIYAVFVEGNEAFWAPGGMRLYPPLGTVHLKVFDESQAFLTHDGESPWMHLDRPLEPGVELRLSFAVSMRHDGELEFEWSTPFPLVDDASIVSVPEELKVTRGVAGAPEVDPHGGRGDEPIEIYSLGHERFEPGICDVLATAGQPCVVGGWSGNDLSLVVEDLPVRSRVWPIIGWSLLGLTALVVGSGMILRRRVGAREALIARRDALMAELVALDERGIDDQETRRARLRMLRALDRIYRQLEALERA